MLSANNHSCKNSGFTVSHSSFLSHLSLNSPTSAWGCFARPSCYGDSVRVTTAVASQSGTTLVGTEMCYDRQRSPRLLSLLECTTTQKKKKKKPQASVASPLLDLNQVILLFTHKHTHAVRHLGTCSRSNISLHIQHMSSEQHDWFKLLGGVRSEGLLLGSWPELYLEVSSFPQTPKLAFATSPFYITVNSTFEGFLTVSRTKQCKVGQTNYVLLKKVIARYIDNEGNSLQPHFAWAQ